LVLLHSVGVTQVLQVSQPVGALGRDETHVDEVVEACPGKQADIPLEHIIPFGCHAIEVEGGHPDTFLWCHPHVAEVRVALIEQGKRSGLPS
jgi:hypothetical protein